jgi:hypothetical protein
MEACVGIHEVGGNNDGPDIRLIQKTIGGASREPWCMALQQTGIAYAELKTGIRSPIFPTEHCMTCFRETPREQRAKISPLKYAIVIWQRDGTDQGHTGAVVESFYPQWFRSVEGNSNGPRVGGDEVCYQKRSWARDGKLKVMGFLKPF